MVHKIMPNNQHREPPPGRNKRGSCIKINKSKFSTGDDKVILLQR